MRCSEWGAAHYGVEHSYPAWFFSEEKLVRFFVDSRYKIVFRFSVPQDVATLDDGPFLQAYSAILFQKA